MKIIYCIFLAIPVMGILSGCGKKSQPENVVKVQDSIITPKDTVAKVDPMDNHVFNKWLGATIGSTLPLDTAKINKAKFTSFENYEKLNEKVKELKYFEVKNVKPEITIENEMIMLAYEDDGMNFERFICTPERVIISYHAGFGDGGGSYVISLITNEVKSSDYTIFKVKGNTADICSDFIGDDGHTWTYGKLDLITDSIVWGKTEH